MTTKTTALAVLILTLSTATFASPSFDCKKASTKVEKLICSDHELSDLDAMIAEQYNDVRGTDSSDAVKQSQVAWVKKVRNTCADVSCLKQAYEKRGDELAAERARAVQGQKTAQ